MKFLPLDVLKNVLNMVPKKRVGRVVKKFLAIFYKDMNDVLQAEPLYFKLRSLLDSNSFPFDMDYQSLPMFKYSISTST